MFNKFLIDNLVFTVINERETGQISQINPKNKTKATISKDKTELVGPDGQTLSIEPPDKKN